MVNILPGCCLLANTLMKKLIPVVYEILLNDFTVDQVITDLATVKHTTSVFMCCMRGFKYSACDTNFVINKRNF